MGRLPSFRIMGRYRVMRFSGTLEPSVLSRLAMCESYNTATIGT